MSKTLFLPYRDQFWDKMSSVSFLPTYSSKSISSPLSRTLPITPPNQPGHSLSKIAKNLQVYITLYCLPLKSSSPSLRDMLILLIFISVLMLSCIIRSEAILYFFCTFISHIPYCRWLQQAECIYLLSQRYQVRIKNLANVSQGFLLEQRISCQIWLARMMFVFDMVAFASPVYYHYVRCSLGSTKDRLSSHTENTTPTSSTCTLGILPSAPVRTSEKIITNNF